MKLGFGLACLVFIFFAISWTDGYAVQILKIQSLRSGVIVVDGKTASRDHLREILTKAKGAMVWYYREIRRKRSNT